VKLTESWRVLYCLAVAAAGVDLFASEMTTGALTADAQREPRPARRYSVGGMMSVDALPSRDQL